MSVKKGYLWKVTINGNEYQYISETDVPTVGTTFMGVANEDEGVYHTFPSYSDITATSVNVLETGEPKVLVDYNKRTGNWIKIGYVDGGYYIKSYSSDFVPNSLGATYYFIGENGRIPTTYVVGEFYPNYESYFWGSFEDEPREHITYPVGPCGVEKHDGDFRIYCDYN